MTAAVSAAGGTFQEMANRATIAAVVARTLELYSLRSIDLPRIVVVPTGEVTTGYNDFDLDVQGIALQPVPQEIPSSTCTQAA